MYGIEELVAEICNLPEDSDYQELDEAVYSKLGVTVEDFEKVVEVLLPHTPLVEAAISGQICNAFISKKHPNTMLIKKVIA